MIAMSNFEEFARAVGKDVKDIKEQQLTKNELNSKDFITGNSEYDFLKRSVQELERQNKLLQEQLALVKPAPRRAPMAYTMVVVMTMEIIVMLFWDLVSHIILQSSWDILVFQT